jgi:hypothetical protein
MKQTSIGLSFETKGKLDSIHMGSYEDRIKFLLRYYELGEKEQKGIILKMKELVEGVENPQIPPDTGNVKLCEEEREVIKEDDKIQEREQALDKDKSVPLQ